MSEKNKERIICPVCKSEKAEIFCQKGGYKLYTCQVCDLVFVWPLPDNLEDHYTENYFKLGAETGKAGYVDYEEDKKSMNRTFEMYLDKFEKLITGRYIFDIGSATGYFLDIARGRGWKTGGIDISVYAVNEARKKGHSVLQGDMLSLTINNRYDVVTAWDVFEHIKDPRGYIEKSAKILRQGGLLAINTLNRGSFWARIMGRQWHAILPPDHLIYFNNKNLEDLLEQNNFSILEVSNIGKSYSLSTIFKTVYYWSGKEIWNKIAVYFDRSFWRKFSIPINLKDNIFIIAKLK